ncbi:TPA: hypothetical protein IU268_001715 [Enterococcus faecalis]|nr:hypothetical protein [Enterococcus faecalis]
MKFDAIEQRKQQEQKKPRKVRKELARYKRDRAKNVNQMRILQTELEKMKYIEKEYKKFASYLVIYGETEKELNENFAIIKRFSELFEPQLLKRDQIKKILALLNNTGGVMLSDEKENSH